MERMEKRRMEGWDEWGQLRIEKEVMEKEETCKNGKEGCRQWRGEEWKREEVEEGTRERGKGKDMERKKSDIKQKKEDRGTTGDGRDCDEGNGKTGEGVAM